MEPCAKAAAWFRAASLLVIVSRDTSARISKLHDSACSAHTAAADMCSAADCPQCARLQSDGYSAIKLHCNSFR
eukprot:2811-Heterococcus_DN1.PRE.4